MKALPLIGLFVALAVAAGLLWWALRPSPVPMPALVAAATPAAFSPPPAPAKPAPSPEAAAKERLDEFARSLGATGDAAERRRILGELRAYLASLPRGLAVVSIRSFMDAQKDVATGLAFRITTGGGLEEAPTLRVWLLDCLAQVDPAAAAEYARNLLATSTSPDEWALGLRNFARVRTTPDNVAFVQGKLHEMLGNPAWLQNPSAGFLEAFDALVYTHATSFTPDLTRLVQDTQNRAAAHAAYLTLDRLIIQDPAAVLSQLEADPASMQGREQTRANYFARADVQDDQQRGLLEKYLLDSARTPQELQTFAGLYPSGNYMISNNLLTIVQTPTRDELAQRDSATLQTVEQWMSGPRFAALQPQLQKIHTRLQTFVRQETAKSALGWNILN